MKFQADREVLGEAISFVARLMSPKPQLPQLSGVMITAGTNEVVLSIFDYEVSAKVSIAAAVDAPGKAIWRPNGWRRKYSLIVPSGQRVDSAILRYPDIIGANAVRGNGHSAR